MTICFIDGQECKETVKPDPYKVSMLTSPVSSLLGNPLSQEAEKYAFWTKCLWGKYKYNVERIILPYDSQDALCGALCRKILQSKIVVIDMTFQDPHILSALFLARENRKIVWLIAHANGKLLHDFDGKNSVITYGNSGEGVRAFCGKLEKFITSLPDKDHVDPPPPEKKIIIPKSANIKIPMNVNLFAFDLSKNKNMKENSNWDILVDLVQQNDSKFNQDLSSLRLQWRTVNLKDDILSFLLPMEQLGPHFEGNARYYRHLFEEVIFALTGKNIIVKANTVLNLDQ